MLKRTITFTDYNGVRHTEDHHFHLSKVDLVRLEVAGEKSFAEYLQDIVKTEDRKGLIEIFEKLIQLSYGKRSDDGLNFYKTPEITQAFISSPAYEEMFMQLATDADAASAFINGVMPADMLEEGRKLQASRQLPPPPPSPAQ